MTYAHYTKVSSNITTGPMSVTVSDDDTCPPTCPLRNGGGCYAESGPISIHWRKVSGGDRGGSWDDMCAHVRRIPGRQLWRHNVAGDLPHTNGVIDAGMVDQLVRANGASAGFTYTHHEITARQPYYGIDDSIPTLSTSALQHNASIVRDSSDRGLTVNLSANNARQADDYADMGIAPVVTVLPIDAPKVSRTPAGRKIVRCPAKGDGDITCTRCGLCAKSDRDYIIGFPAHGSRKAKAHLVALPK